MDFSLYLTVICRILNVVSAGMKFGWQWLIKREPGCGSRPGHFSISGPDPALATMAMLPAGDFIIKLGQYLGG